ncbi:MAG: hypothetical protein RTV72_11165 [Candidatus Thorarchaeota archaeon]
MSLQKRTVQNAIIITLALLICLLPIMPVEASEPENIALVYDFDSQTLTVNVSHYVSNTKNHYIENIEIWKNDISILNSTYTNQTFNWGMYDSFTVATDVGDNLTVTATCNLQGYTITSWLIVSSTTVTNSPTTTDTTTNTTDATDGPESPGNTGNVGLAIIVVIVLILFFTLFFAWLKPEYVPERFKQIGSRVRGANS